MLMSWCANYGKDIGNSVTKIEKKMGIKIRPNKNWGYGPGDPVSYKTNCNVREKPSNNSQKIGTINGKTVYYVVLREKWSHWRLIQTEGQRGTKDAIGWVGCYP
jgi:uncharacterized protein YgiM (DUF1202 family)